MTRGNRAFLYGVATLVILLVGFLGGLRVDQKVKTYYTEQGKQFMVMEIVYETIFIGREFSTQCEVLEKRYHVSFVPRAGDKKVGVVVKKVDKKEVK